MMDWTGPKQGKLRKALLNIYPGLFKLRLFIKDNFECDLTDIGGTSPEEWAEELITKAASEGWLDELYEKFCLINKDNSCIHELLKELDDTSRLLTLVTSAKIIEGVRSNNEVTHQQSELFSSIKNPRIGYLVIAVFWQERTYQKFRVQLKLCRQDSQKQEIVQEPLTQEDVSVDLKNFPDFVKEIISFTSKKLTNYFPDPINPWKLVISLFVPVDLLSFPLSNWCGKNDNISLEYPIVLGCSDRFDPNRSQDAEILRNHLKEGWQRLQRDIQNGQCKLHNITWLNSDQAISNSLKKYSGFQCYGNWLRLGEEYLTNWQELIKSGIPLALWMEKGELGREKIKDNFYKLTDCHHLNFLEYIPQHRDEQWKTYEDYVGIFYEDPNNVPDVPRSEVEQFFVWPGT